MRRSQRAGIVFFLVILILAGFSRLGPDLRADTTERDFVYPDEFDRDPLEPLINAEGVININLVRQAGDLRINGIIYSPEAEDRRAIINNILVKVGDYIGSYKIEKIAAASVVLDKKGKQVTLTIKKEE